MKTPKRTVFLLVQWGIGIAALVWALSDVELALLWDALASYPLVAMLPVFFFAAIDYLSMGFRLACLLPEDVGFVRSTRAVLLCTGMNCLLPAKAGDALKIVYLTRTSGHSFVAISSVIFWERLCDVIVLVLLLAFSWTQIGEDRLSMSLTLPLGVLAAGTMCFFLLRHWSGFFHALYARFLPCRIANPLSHLHSCVIDQVSIPWVARGLLWSLASWGTYFFSFLFTLGPMGGLSLSLSQMLVVFTVACLGTAIPSLPGGIGLFEGAMVLALSWYGVESSQALGLALFFHAVHFFPLALAAVIINGRINYWSRPQAPGAPA